MRISNEVLQGRTVIGSDGQVIGEVTTLMVNCDVWRVESVKVKLRKDIADQVGAIRTVFHAGALEIPVSMVQSVGDTLVLAVAVHELRKVLPNQLGPDRVQGRSA